MRRSRAADDHLRRDALDPAGHVGFSQPFAEHLDRPLRELLDGLAARRAGVRLTGDEQAVVSLYPDIPGMGNTPPDGSMRSANDVVDLLDAFVSSEIGTEPFLLIGHSYGAHLARGLAARRPDQVAGLALICPVVASNTAELVSHSTGALGRAERT